MKTIFVTLLAFTLLLLSCIKDEKEDVINYIEENHKLPEFTVKSVTGEELRSEDLSGNTTLLVFFVTTCGDCKRELPKIDSVWNELKDQPTFRLVTISRGETAEVVNAFWKEQNFTMPFYLDPDKKVFSLFANSTIPRVYLVNRENIVTWMAVEQMDLSAKQLIGKIEQTINSQN